MKRVYVHSEVDGYSQEYDSAHDVETDLLLRKAAARLLRLSPTEFVRAEALGRVPSPSDFTSVDDYFEALTRLLWAPWNVHRKLRIGTHSWRCTELDRLKHLYNSHDSECLKASVKRHVGPAGVEKEVKAKLQKVMREASR